MLLLILLVLRSYVNVRVFSASLNRSCSAVFNKKDTVERGSVAGTWNAVLLGVQVWSY